MDNLASEKNKSKSANSKFLFTRRELATIFDVNETVVDKWRKKGCPTSTPKKFDIRDVVKWRQAETGDFNLDGELEQKSVNEQYNYYKMQTAKADSQLKSFKVDLESGKYLLKDEVEKNVGDCLMMFKKSLKNLHVKLITKIASYLATDDQKKVMVIIEDEIKGCLSRFSDGNKYV